MICTENERFSVADCNVQPMEQAGIGIIWFVLMGIASQSWDIASVPIAVDDTAWGKCSLGKLFDRRPLDVLCELHLDMTRIPPLIQRHSRKDLCLFRSSTPLFPNSRSSKIGIIKFNGPTELVCFVPLTHGGTDTRKHIPCGFVGRSQHRHQRSSGNASFVLTDKVKCQKPLCQRHMGLVKHRSRRY